MSKLHEALLGYDAREMWLHSTDVLHPTHRPSEFLLREGVKKVLSADVNVWPSLFGGSGLALASGQLPHLEKPEWTGANPPFWQDLPALDAALAAQAEALQQPYSVIAATWHEEAEFPREASQEQDSFNPQLALYVQETNPPVRDAQWRPLGFDVTDAAFTSGLSDCAYGARRTALAGEWSRYLNDRHLFDDLEKAFEFRAITNERVPEHAPFFVIGLWVVREA